MVSSDLRHVFLKPPGLEVQEVKLPNSLNVSGVLSSLVSSQVCCSFFLTVIFSRGTWVAQSAEHLTLDFGSGHDLRVCESYADGVEPA